MVRVNNYNLGLQDAANDNPPFQSYFRGVPDEPSNYVALGDTSLEFGPLKLRSNRPGFEKAITAAGILAGFLLLFG